MAKEHFNGWEDVLAWIQESVKETPKEKTPEEKAKDTIYSILNMSIMDFLNMPISDLMKIAQNFSGLLENSPELAAVMSGLKEKFESTTQTEVEDPESQTTTTQEEAITTTDGSQIYDLDGTSDTELAKKIRMALESQNQQ